MDKKLITAFLLVLALTSANIFAISPILAEPSNPDVEQKIFIHYAKGMGRAKPPKEETGYYKLLGVKWMKYPIHLEVNPNSAEGVLEDNIDVVFTVQLAAEEWDDGAYSGWGGVAPNLINGSITLGYINVTKTDRTNGFDGHNVICWGDYPTEGVIAVTYLLYNRRTKEILEFDIVLDTDYKWGNATISGNNVMDLQNILTHELGHGLGLGDLYQTTAIQETMYGYSDYGETIKRDLYMGDKTGITKLYGSG
ncbi:MAG: matrixin family metalloprotease [Thermoproteota archaeon]